MAYLPTCGWISYPLMRAVLRLGLMGHRSHLLALVLVRWTATVVLWAAHGAGCAQRVHQVKLAPV